MGGRLLLPLPGQVISNLCGQAWETLVLRLVATIPGSFSSALGMVCRKEGRSWSSRLPFSLLGVARS